MIQPEGDVKMTCWVGLRSYSARILKLAQTCILRVIANLFDKQGRLLGYLLFDHKSCFRDAFGSKLGGAEEFRQHSAQAPTIVAIPTTSICRTSSKSWR